MITISAEQIDRAAQEMSVIKPWGYEEYRKVGGEWVLSYFLVLDKPNRRTLKVDAVTGEDGWIKWGEVIA